MSVMQECVQDNDDILQVENICKYYKASSGKLFDKTVFKAVNQVSFSVKRGETFGLVGESGCGKSTLAKLVMKLMEASGGKVIFDGENILEYDKQKMKQKRSDMQIIFQDPYSSLNPRMTVSQSIAAPLLIQGVYKANEKDKIQKKVDEMMDLVGLAKRFANSYPHELDGGRRQRIGIARALSLNPKFIVCDEPVSALDVSIQAQVLNLMQDLQEQMGLTYIFITHDLSVVNHFADDIAVMYLGQLIEKAPSEQLFDKPTHPYTQALLSAIPVPSLKKRRERIILKGEITSPINPKPGCRFAARCPYATDRCRSEEPVLREIEPNHFVACHLTEGK